MLTRDSIHSKVRCPSCGKVVADSIKGEASFTCPRCKIGFTVRILDKISVSVLCNK